MSSKQTKSEILDYNREPPASNFDVDLKKAEKVWGRKFSSLSNLFSTKLHLPGENEPINIPTHMLGQSEGTIRIIAYRSGTTRSQGWKEADQEDLVRYIPPGELAISVKHRCPRPIPEPFDKLKFQCRHVQVAVGVKINDKPGVVTINQPQDYHRYRDQHRQDEVPYRLFGNADYPMFFIKPKFPDGLSARQKRQYVDNIRTWVIIANTFTEFPSRETYNGKDPIATHCVEKIEILGEKLLRAMIGERQAKEWLKAEENKVYCSEFVHAALNLGIHYPLNKRMLPENLYRRVEEEIKTGVFLGHNPNEFASHVKLQMAPEDLRPITEVAKPKSQDPALEKIFDPRLATRLYTWADMLVTCMQKTIPRKERGESLAPLQRSLLLEMKETMLELFFLRSTSESHSDRQKFERIYSEMLDVVERSYEKYEEFQNKLTPLTEQLRQLSRDLQKAVDYIITPNCYLVNATESLEGKSPGGILEWQYLGHGLHDSMLKTK